jgi:hypothetical protein
MKNLGLLLMMIIPFDVYSQKSFKPITIKVITTQQKTITGILYSISDSAISLISDSKIDWKQLQSRQNNNENTMTLITAFSYREIEEVKAPLHNAVLLGIIGGALAGARAGRWLGVALDANDNENKSSATPIAMGFLTLNGAIIGGMLIPHHITYVIKSDKRSFKGMIAEFEMKYSPNQFLKHK